MDPFPYDISSWPRPDRAPTPRTFLTGRLVPLTDHFSGGRFFIGVTAL
jgi:hypothetical protein